ncbi:MAG: HNH endonuclease [Terriglobales bacterium]
MKNSPPACLFCSKTEHLTDEHIFPASLGGDDVVEKSTCIQCNGIFSDQFEASFNNSMKFFCWLFQIGNRQGVIPNMEATAIWQGAELKVVVRHDGSIRPLGRPPTEVVGQDGRKQFEYLFPTLRERKKFEAWAKAKGKEIIPITDPIVVQPGSSISMDFIGEDAALRAATKVAFMCLALKCGVVTARSDTFKDVREFIRTGKGTHPARLFVNPTFSHMVQSGPHQHSVFAYLNAQDCTVWAIVRFFGGLSYLVQLSDSYTGGVDYGFFYIYDAYRKQQEGMLLGQYDMEKVAIETIINGATTFDDVGAAAEHFLDFIKSSIKQKFGENAIT